MPKDWGICERCHKSSSCERYVIEVGMEDKEAQVFEPCRFDLKKLTHNWFSTPVVTADHDKNCLCYHCWLPRSYHG